MLLGGFLYLGENEPMEEQNKQFHEMQKVIKNDFRIFLNYILVNYNNKENLEKEIKTVYDNICFSIPYAPGHYFENIIDVDDEFVSFNYNLNTGMDFELEVYIAVVRRNYKEFYFIYPSNEIKKFVIKDNKVINKTFNLDNELDWCSKYSILESISYLNDISYITK